MKLKEQFRVEAKDRLKSLSSNQRADNSKVICEKLLNNLLKGERYLAVYAPFAEEVDISALYLEHFNSFELIAFPRFNKSEKAYEMVVVSDLDNDLEMAHYGILEPKPTLPELKPDAIEQTCILVPGLAFSKDCTRLGRGKGYYDRILSSPYHKKIGVAHNAQIMTDLPSEQHDVPMDFVITEMAQYEHEILEE